MSQFSFDYFQDEFRRFWDLCGSTSMTGELLLRALNGLFYVAANAEGDSKRIALLLETAVANYERRLPYFIAKDARTVLERVGGEG